MLKITWLFCALFFIKSGLTQFGSVQGVRQNGLGNSGINMNDVWSIRNNPGAFAFMDETQASLIYQNRFLLPELATQGLAFGHKTQKGNVGVNFLHSGFDLFRTLQLGGTYAIAFSPKFGMGFNFNYQQTRFGDVYGVKHHFAAGIGVQYKLNKNVFISAAVQNINRSKVSSFENERLPTFFGLGLLYRISPKVLWLLDVEKELLTALNVKSALELKVHEYFDVRLGVNSLPFQSSFGFGTNVKKLQVDLAAIWHSQLGLAPSFGVVYVF